MNLGGSLLHLGFETANKGLSTLGLETFRCKQEYSALGTNNLFIMIRGFTNLENNPLIYLPSVENQISRFLRP